MKSGSVVFMCNWCWWSKFFCLCRPCQGQSFSTVAVLGFLGWRVCMLVAACILLLSKSYCSACSRSLWFVSDGRSHIKYLSYPVYFSCVLRSHIVRNCIHTGRLSAAGKYNQRLRQKVPLPFNTCPLAVPTYSAFTSLLLRWIKQDRIWCRANPLVLALALSYWLAS